MLASKGNRKDYLRSYNIIISPRLNVREGDQYVITLTTNHGTGSTPYTWSLYAGTSTDHADMATKIADVTTHKTSEETPQSFIIKASDVATMADDAADDNQIVTVPTGVMTLGFHASGKVKNVTVKNFSVTKNQNTGISDGAAEFDGNFDVFDLTGIKVLSNATRADLKGLAKGFYIIRKNTKSLKISL